MESNLPFSATAQIEERRASKNYQVLVVEDNKTNQFIAKTIIEQVGVSVVLTDNEEEGATYYANSRSSVYICFKYDDQT